MEKRLKKETLLKSIKKRLKTMSIKELKSLCRLYDIEIPEGERQEIIQSIKDSVDSMDLDELDSIMNSLDFEVRDHAVILIDPGPHRDDVIRILKESKDCYEKDAADLVEATMHYFPVIEDCVSNIAGRALVLRLRSVDAKAICQSRYEVFREPESLG